MKKISLLLLLILALCLIFTACGQTVATEIIARWEDGEEYVFNITKANWDYAPVVVNGNDYVKYPRTAYENISASKDELVPEDIGGTYSMKLNKTESKFTLTTEQYLYVQYADAALANLGLTNLAENADWKQFVVGADETCPLEQKEGYTILLSHDLSTVVFEQTSAQRPLSSTNKREGFYIGKTHQEITRYDLSTVYDWENNKVTVSENGAEKHSGKLNPSAKFIDANQMLLYVRSLDKQSNKFQDSPSVQVFSPVACSSYKANITYFQYACRALLLDEKGEDVPVVLNSVCVVVDGSVLLNQLNLPDTVNKDNSNLDVLLDASANQNKYTTVSFRSGLVNYELQSHDAKVLEAITVKSSAEEQK